MYKNITTIIPVHKFDDSVKELLPIAVKSIKQQKQLPSEVLVVISKEEGLKEFVETLDYEGIKVLVNEGETDFCSQINFAVENITNEWFSVLEYDDEFSSIWFDNVDEYMKHYVDVDVFLPMVVDVNDQNDFIGFTNEAVWANSFSEELGYLDTESLLTYQNFNIDGMVVNKEKFQEFGGLKSHMKLTFIYEFLLRMTYNSAKIMVIPKIGYKHVNQREGSLFNEYKTTMNPLEAKFWLSKAKTEYFNVKDRLIKYTE